MSETTTQSIDDGAADERMIAFVDGGPSADLSDWVRRFPEHGPDFANVVAARWAASFRDETADSNVVSAESIARFRAIGREIASARRGAARTAPLTSLVAAARERGIDARTLAARLRVPYALFFKLHRRLIAADSVPRSIVERLSESLGRTADEINAYFRMPPTLAAGASYRADRMPTATAQELFADALAGDPDATAEQIALHSAAVSDEA